MEYLLYLYVGEPKATTINGKLLLTLGRDF